MKNEPKLFYKYKSLSNFEYVLDILLYERLYAGRYHELNDPMEGVIELDGSTSPDQISEWEKSLKRFNICCFTTDPDNSLMWSHYADGGKGCVIEFELYEDTPYSKVIYGKPPVYKSKEFTYLDAKEILNKKLKYWKYENEYRSILDGDFYLPVKIKSIKFGPRCDKEKRLFLTRILACCKPELAVSRHCGYSVINPRLSELSEVRVIRVIGPRDHCEKCRLAEFHRKSFALWRPREFSNKHSADKIASSLTRALLNIAKSS